MSALLSKAPYGTRDNALFLEEMNSLTRHHLECCAEYSRIWPDWHGAASIEDIPFLHVGVFKYAQLRTNKNGLKHERILKSSSTTSSHSAMIALDTRSSKLQSESSTKILTDFVGNKKRILLIIDSARSLRHRGEVSARIAAAMSIKPLSTDIRFLLDKPDDPNSMKWDTLKEALDKDDDFIVYGFSWILWLAWQTEQMPSSVKSALKDKRFHFVHSGGWKKMEESKIDRERFESSLIGTVHPSSKVVDFYGLVEQVGVIYPLCKFGFRHVPVWADVLVRDTYTLASLEEETGQLQFMNTLAYGAPYHSVLTEDLGRIIRGECTCGRQGKRWQMMGRMPKAEIRGCANV